MKKFLICALFMGLVFSNNVFSQGLKLMNPVKLKNPENENLGFKTPVPSFNPNIVMQRKVNSQPVIKSDKVKEVAPVKLQPIVKIEEKVEIESTPTNIQETIKIQETFEDERTDKNINEAKALLKVAEKLANSIKDEKDLMEKDDFNIATLSDKDEKHNIVIKFSANQEEVSSADKKIIVDSVADKGNNPDTYFKIISYYDNPENRNVAFSRLLNTRKVLLDKGIKTSQTMIMVLEDDTKEKSNTVEIAF